MATKDKWAAIETQQKDALNTIQDELQALQLKIDTLQTSMIQVIFAPKTSNAVINMPESCLYPLLSATLIPSPHDLGVQVQACAEVQLDIAFLPHEPLQLLHASLFEEI